MRIHVLPGFSKMNALRLASGLVMLVHKMEAYESSPAFMIRHTLQWGSYWFGFVLATNVSATGLIAGRIW